MGKNGMLENKESVTKKYDLVIVLTTLNEEKGLESTINSINVALEGKFSYVIVVVDGLSTDRTVEVAKSMGAIVIKQRRRGVGDALQAGFHYVDTKLDSQITVMLDADGTYEPKDIVKMVEIINKGDADFVIGNRFANMDKNAMPRLNQFGNKVLSAISRKTLGTKVYDWHSGLRVFKSDLASIFYTSSMGFPFPTEMLAAVKSHHIRYKEIPTSYHKRIGKANLTPLQDGARIFGTIIRLLRDTRPLAFFGLIGLAIIGIGILSGYDVVRVYLETGTVLNVATAVLTALLIIIGVQTISLGLISDMIKSRTYEKRIFYNE